ncbi:hypothetical protein GY065_10130 [Snodgrassella sp. ESL0323]|uniref:hypothetical protein n=1 Tax=Snodgrassella sp. ESL0323 TaxID=2705034 RepID=UPI001582B039|nr:hypothetical protein [Snodgrassella sp. ESL0323]NUF79260.1 hypothetical protein [Snodgrassella sp. ESL0323]
MHQLTVLLPDLPGILSTASVWLYNCVASLIAPYQTKQGTLKEKQTLKKLQ